MNCKKDFKFSLVVLSFLTLLGLNSCGEEPQLIDNPGNSELNGYEYSSELEYNYDGGVTLPEGLDLIINQPKGEISYYEATKTTIYSSEEVKYLVPVVKATDGYTYIRNLTGEEIFNGIGLWIQCTPDKENNRLIIAPKSPYGYSILNRNVYIEPKIYDYNTQDSIFDGVYSLYLGNRTSEYIVEIDKTYPDIILDINGDGSISFHNESPDTKGICGRKDGRTSDSHISTTINRLELRPYDLSPITPPRNVTYEKWQVKYNSYSYIQEGYREPENDDYKKGTLIKCAIDNNEIYFQGLSNLDKNGDPEIFIKGEITDGKVIFNNGKSLGLTNDGRPIYFSVFKTEITDNGFTLIPTPEDLIFDYDRVNGIVSNPNLCFGFTTRVFNQQNDFDSSDLLQVFYNAEFKRIPQGIEQIPQRPEIIYIDDGGSYPYIRIWITNIDTNGYVIDPDKLYIKSFSEGKEIPLYDYWNDRCTDFVMKYGFCRLYKIDYNLISTNTRSRCSYSTGLTVGYHYLIYLKDGKEILSDTGIWGSY